MTPPHEAQLRFGHLLRGHVPYTKIVFDHFSAGTDREVFFLSHIGSGPLASLDRALQGDELLICSSRVRRALRILRPDIEDHNIRVVDPGERIDVPYGSGDRIFVQAIDANSLYGAVMFVVDGSFGRVLYTGKFRYDALVHDAVLPRKGSVSVLYFDAWFAEQGTEFPSQKESISSAAMLLGEHLSSSHSSDAWVFAEEPGSEGLVRALADAAREPLHLADSMSAVVWAGAPEELREKLSGNSSSRVHIASCGDASVDQYACAQQRSELVLVLSPRYHLLGRGGPRKRGRALTPEADESGIWHVPFAVRSGLTELQDFYVRVGPSVAYAVCGSALGTPILLCADRVQNFLTEDRFVVQPGIAGRSGTRRVRRRHSYRD